MSETDIIADILSASTISLSSTINLDWTQACFNRDRLDRYQTCTFVFVMFFFNVKAKSFRVLSEEINQYFISKDLHSALH